MKSNEVLRLTVAVAALLGVVTPAAAAAPVSNPLIGTPVAAPGGQVIVPASSVRQPAGSGVVNTNFYFFEPVGGTAALNAAIDANPQPLGLPPFSGYAFETPASLACIYKLVAAPVAGCNPNVVTTVATGGSKAIAIVDAYHYPYAKTDLTAFSTQFGLPLPTTTNFQVVYASGVQPPTDPNGWEVEAALDLQWSHAMAPGAKLYLVEAASSAWIDMNTAVSKASALVAAAGGGQVSMSYGGSEFPTETGYEPFYKTNKVVYFASSGDAAGTLYPCTSPNVVCVGGTSARRDSDNQGFLG